MTGRARALKLLWAAAASLAAALAWAQSLEVIELEHRTAEELMPVIEPLLEPGGALTGQGYTLFLRASSTNAAQIRQAVAQLDRAPRQFLVTVRQASAQEMEREGVLASAEIGKRGAGVTVHATGSDERREGGGVASVSVLEGQSAFVATGGSIPIVTAVAAGGGKRPWAAISTTHRNLSSGFLVTPRAQGEGVMLEIEQQTEGFDRGQITTQRLATKISARLGDWVRLGGVSEATSSERSGLLIRSHRTSRDDREVWIKVEEQ